MPGRPPKPTHLKLAEGNPGRRKLHPEPEPASGIPLRPRHLRPLERGAWNRYARILSDMGVLTVADGLGLELVAKAYADWRRADLAVEQHGLTYDITILGETTVRARPEVGIRNDAWKRLHAGLAQFGLTPAARTRIHLKAPDKPHEKAKRLFGA